MASLALAIAELALGSFSAYDHIWANLGDKWRARGDSRSEMRDLQMAHESQQLGNSRDITYKPNLSFALHLDRCHNRLFAHGRGLK